MKLSWIRGAGVSIGLVLALVLPHSGSANTLAVPALRDATLIESPTGSLANGSGPHFFAGRTGQPSGSIRRGVVAFDVAAHVPPGATVTAARLTLHMSQSNAGSVAASLHRALAASGEGPSNASGGSGAPAAPGDATWVHTFFDHSFWAAPGGDFLAARSASQVVGAEGSYTWGSTPELVADVQSWVDDPASNHGWILVGDESAPTTVKRFDSRESADDSLRPVLEVEFGRPGSACSDAGLTGKAWGVCAAYCEELDCDGESPLATPIACTRLDRVFERLTSGALLPCEDDDADGVEDVLDNCPAHPNAEQSDGDLDGVGDACDNCPAQANPLQEEGFGDPTRGDACDCPCFSTDVVTALVLTLDDAATYEGLLCIDTRVNSKPLTAVRAERSDGASCGATSADCSALAIEFTEDQICQLNPPAPAASLTVSISEAQREACRVNLLAAAASVDLPCN
jgi:hypothetical protein